MLLSLSYYLIYVAFNRQHSDYMNVSHVGTLPLHKACRSTCVHAQGLGCKWVQDVLQLSKYPVLKMVVLLLVRSAGIDLPNEI